MSNLLNTQSFTEQSNGLQVDAAMPTLAIDRQPISFNQVLQWLRSTGKLPTFLQELSSQYVIEQELQQQPDLDVDASKVEEAIAHFRQQNGLQDSQAFEQWLLDQCWDETIFCKQVQFNLKLDRFKAKLAAPKLTEAFIQHKLLLDQVVLSRIVVHSQDLAEELKIQIAEEGASFEQLAQAYSQAEDAMTNGMVGQISRAEAQSWFETDVYQFQVGEIVGPICQEQNWCLLRVEKILPAELDESVQEYLQEQIFQQWLEKKIQVRSLELHLSDIETRCL